MKFHVPALLIAPALMIFGLAQAAEPKEQIQTTQQPAQLDRSLLFPSSTDISEGEILATEQCVDCHSATGIEDDPEMPHLAGQHVLYLYTELQAYKNKLRENEDMSKSVQFLSDDAMRKVSAYYARQIRTAPAVVSVSENAPPAVVSDPVELGKTAAASCGGCHGPDGNSVMPGMPNLTSQPLEYFATAMHEYKNGGRPSMMSGFAAALNDQTIKNIALFYGVQVPKATGNVGSGDVEAGKTSAGACSTCHGADGNTPGVDLPTLAGQDATYLAAAIKAYAKGQRSHTQMVAATENLSDAEINNLATFYAQQQPLARKIHRPPTTADWIARCNRCHGENGNSSDPRMPSLAGQNVAYLERVLALYAEGARNNSMMSAMATPLTPEDRAALAAHYAAQTPRSILYVELPCEQIPAK